MKKQYYILGQLSDGKIKGYIFRYFTVPVHQVEGLWVPAGQSTEETHLYDQASIALDLMHWQVHTDNTAGKLDDLPCPDGWTVMARDWLPDDYKPPAEGDVEARREEGIRFLRGLGLWKDK